MHSPIRVQPRTPFKLITYVQTPSVILKVVCMILAAIIFMNINSEGKDERVQKGRSISVTAYIMCLPFLSSEYYFQIRKMHIDEKKFALSDFGFSSVWALLYFAEFYYSIDGWNKEISRNIYGINTVQVVIVCFLFSFFTCVGSAWLAFQTLKQQKSPISQLRFQPFFLINLFFVYFCGSYFY